MVGAGVLIKPLLGFPHHVGVVLVGLVVTLIVVTAGMVSTNVGAVHQGIAASDFLHDPDGLDPGARLRNRSERRRETVSPIPRGAG